MGFEAAKLSMIELFFIFYHRDFVDIYSYGEGVSKRVFPSAKQRVRTLYTSL